MQKLKWGLVLLAFSLAHAGGEARIELEGVPLHMEWIDLDGDGHRDLIALMLQSVTEGNMETWIEEGSLRGLYADQTSKEKYLATFIYDGGVWQKKHHLELGKDSVLGFTATNLGPEPALMLWRNTVMVRHLWRGGEWVVERQLGTPGLLAGEASSLAGFPFWYENQHDAWWLVPDLQGVHVVSLSKGDTDDLIPYPLESFASDVEEGNYHRLTLDMPELQRLDGDARPELVMRHEHQVTGYQLGSVQPQFFGEAEGRLVDLDGDGMADLMKVETHDDVDRIKDLPKMKSHIKTYLATAPLVFAEEPTADQDVPGIVLSSSDDDSDIQLAPPFLDINNDGRLDLAGIALKFSVWGALKAVATGSMRIKFLLNLSVQREDGTFRVLPGGPYPMVWRLNIRRLRMPSFAQLAADFDGDGWMDIMLEKSGKLEITPLTEAGIGLNAKWNQKIPRGFHDADQVFGQDMNGDGRAEFVLLKLEQNRTRLLIMEAKR